MKFLFLVVVLFSVPSFGKSSRIEMKVEDIVSLVIAQYNTHPTLESAAKSLYMTDKSRAEVLAEFKSEKVLKSAVPIATVKGRVVAIKDLKIDFADLKKGFIKFNGKSVQLRTDKSFKMLTDEFKVLAKSTAAFSVLPKAYANDIADVSAVAMVGTSVSAHQAQYDSCLVAVSELDGPLLAKKSTEVEIQRLRDNVNKVCITHLPAATLGEVFSGSNPQDKIAGLECVNGKAISLKTFSRKFSFNEDSTISYTTLTDLLGSKAGCSAVFKSKGGFFSSKKYSLASESSGNCGFVEEADSNIDIGIRKMDLLFEASSKCCSEYPDNIITYDRLSRKKIVVNGKTKMEGEENLCLANLLLRQEAAGEAAKRLQNKSDLKPGVR